MKATILPLAITLIVCTLTNHGLCDDKKTKTEKEINRIEKLLDDHIIKTDPLAKELTLAKFLTTLEGLIPKGSKLSLRVDTDAFGKNLPKLMQAKIDCFARDGQASLRSVLVKATHHVSKQVAADFTLRDGAIMITTPRLAAYAMTYPIRDLRKQLPRLVSLLAEDKETEDALYSDLEASDGVGRLVRMLTNTVELAAWESIEVDNSSRLRVIASPARQGEIVELLQRIRRMADTAVIINARLYEMDRTVYARHVAPHFPKNHKTGECAALSRINDPVFRILCKQKLLLESKHDKILPGQEVHFLSRHSVYHFNAGNLPGDVVRDKRGTGLAGVSFDVRPTITPDRRFMTLQITQRVSQLVGITRTTKLDLSSGKDVEIESPNLRKTTRKGTIHIPDAGAIIMPVDYRPAKGKDKVWVLVARPFIWIEEEVKQIRKQKGDVTPKSIWEGGVPQEDE